VDLASNPETATLGGTATVDAKNGVATFSVKVDKAGNGYTLKATSGAMTSEESVTFDVAGSTHKLVYTDPLVGKLRLVRNPASTDTTVVLDLMAAEDLAAYGVGFNLPVDASRVQLGSTGLVPGTVLNPGMNPVAAMAALPTAGPMAGVLTTVQSQKASGEGAVADNANILSNEVLYTVHIDLAATATPGVVFDGSAALPTGFDGVLRDRAGANVLDRNGFGIGKLEVVSAAE
jgi:hypothetical protein